MAHTEERKRRIRDSIDAERKMIHKNKLKQKCEKMFPNQGNAVRINEHNKMQHPHSHEILLNVTDRILTCKHCSLQASMTRQQPYLLERCNRPGFDTSAPLS